jgi:radical SAM protein with 4Fe4S-binding SPASM domain
VGHYRKDCISFLMATRCNLACTYCYLQNSGCGDQSIDLRFAKQGLQDYFTNSSSRHIRFFGAGEPTLEFDKIKAIWEYAFDLVGHELKTEIQTNGVFPPRVAEWLAERMNIIWISLDGPPDIQDSLRPTIGGGKTSESIERNIAILHKHESERLLVGVRSTITPMNIHRQIEMIEYLRDLGITAIFSDPVFPAVGTCGRTVRSLDLGEDFVMEYAREFLRARVHAEEMGVFYGSILSVNFDERTEYFCRSCLPSPHLTTDGYVTCCDMAFLGDALPELVYGKFDPGTGVIMYNQEKIAAIRMRKASNLVDCKGCNVLFHCAGACFGEGVNEVGHLLGVKKDYCKAIRFLAEHMPLDGSLYSYLHP